MGRPAKSQRLHELMGTKTEANAPSESLIPAGRPSCPRDLSPAARKKFRQLSRELAARRALTRGDSEILAMYAELFDRRARCLEKVRTEGEVIDYESRDKDGNEIHRDKKNTNLLIAQESEKQMLAILIQLGLTVLQRDKAKVTVVDAPVENPQVPGTIGALHPEYFK